MNDALGVAAPGHKQTYCICCHSGYQTITLPIFLVLRGTLLVSLSLYMIYCTADVSNRCDLSNVYVTCVLSIQNYVNVYLSPSVTLLYEKGLDVI